MYYIEVREVFNMRIFTKLLIMSVALLSICACSVSTDEVKGNLEKENYIVHLYNQVTYEDTKFAEDIMLTGNFDCFLEALKANEENKPGEYLYVWFFDDIGSAETFYDLNEISIDNIEPVDGAKLTSGQKNNAVWCGTSAAAGVAKLNSIF